MMSEKKKKKMSLMEFWRTKKERADAVVRANQLRLLPSQWKLLLGDSSVRAALQGSRVASLLPPVGTDVFRRFTPTSQGDVRENKHEVGENPDNDLQAGKSLPFFYGAPPPELLKTPLEELDPHYQSQKTFIVLGVENRVHRFDAGSSCFLFSPLSPLRIIAIKTLIHSFFSIFILLTLLANCVLMMIPFDGPWRDTVEYFFLSIYTFEVVVKVVSRGFCLGKFSFLRDGWNWLDLLIITLPYVMMWVDLSCLHILSSACRVMKIIPADSGLKSAVGSVVQCVRRLGHVVVVMVTCVSICTVIGQQLFMGSLRNTCLMMPSSSGNINDDMDFTSYDSLTGQSYFNYTSHIRNATNYYFLPDQLDALRCGNQSDAGICPEGYTCVRTILNPNYGFTNFDSFGWSLLSVIRLVSKDFWENLVMLVLRTSGKSFVVTFLLIFFPLTFLLLSLIVAVVAMAMGEQEEAAASDAKRKEDEFKQIVRALKKSEEEQLSEDQDDETKEKHASIKGRCGPRCSALFRWDCCGCCRWLKQQLHAIVTNPFFDFVIVVCLIVNIIFLAMEHFPMTLEFVEHLSIASLVFLAIFTAEMFLKIVALDPCGYFQESWNVFESIIVVFSLMGMRFADIEGLSVWRTVHLLRVFRLARWWPLFRSFLKLIGASVRNLSLLLVLFVFLFTVVGTMLFQRDYVDCVCRIATDCELPRWHMADMFHTFLLVVRALGHGQWVETLWDCMEVSGKATCLIFFMTLIVVGQLLILVLFLNLLLNSFILLAPEEMEQNNLLIALSRICDVIRTFIGKEAPVDLDHTVMDKQKEDNKKEYLTLTLVTSDQPGLEVSGETEKDKKREKRCDEEHKHDDDKTGHAPEDCCSRECSRCFPFMDVDQAQGSGRVWSNLRRACFLITQHRSFDVFIIVIIVLSSITLMFEDVHLQQRPVLQQVVYAADGFFTSVFVVEMVLKWFGLGLRRYFTDAWCWLDFLILDVSLLSLMAEPLGLSQLTAVRFITTLRALGPLRATSRFEGLRLVVQVLVRLVPSMFGHLLVALTIWLVFGIMGVNLFAGKFHYCFNETSEAIFTLDEVDNMTECFELMDANFTEVRWKNILVNYDSVVGAYLVLLHVAASADWLDSFYAAVDARRVESQPSYEFNIFMSLYYMCFIIIGYFIVLNFFIRIILDHLQRDEFGGKHLFMTAEQHKRVENMKTRLMLNFEKLPPRPQARCRAWLFDLMTHPYCQLLMLLVVLVYMVSLMLESFDQSYIMDEVMHWIFFCLILILIIEFVLKIIAFGRYYFRSCLNVLDFAVMCISIIGLFLSDLFEKYFVTVVFFPLFRLTLVPRVIHLFHAPRGVRKQLLAFMMSLPALFNICLLFLIILVTFSIFGMFNFAYVQKSAMIDDMYNFETFGSSFICMFLTSTSSGWGGLLLPMLATPPDCDPYAENPGSVVIGDCGRPALGIAFFVSYVVVTALLTIHMYIAVAMTIFGQKEAETLCDNDLHMFHHTWMKFDPDGSHFIQYSQLSDLCDALHDPLRIPKPNKIRLTSMNVPLCPGDKVHCVDVLLSLTAQALGETQQLDSLRARMEEKFLTNPSKVSYEPISSSLQRRREEAAATVIQRAYRKGFRQAAKCVDEQT